MAKKNRGNKGGRVQPAGNNRRAKLTFCKSCRVFYLKQYGHDCKGDINE